MKIEAITISVHYSDFLAYSLPLNKSLFDRMIVVTTPDDRATRDICEHYHVECITTDTFYKDGAKFNKGAGINEGLKHLSYDAWVCHIDADIVLPPRTRQLLEQAELNPLCIYGIDRIMCRSFSEWADYMRHPEVQHSCNTFIQANAFPLGVRVGKLREDGWTPIGFFQLWNPGCSGRKTYREHGTADRGDLLFSRQWPRHKRVLLPEIVAVHLESEAGKMGANWDGRSTRTFGPVLPTHQPSAERKNTDKVKIKKPWYYFLVKLWQWIKDFFSFLFGRGY